MRTFRFQLALLLTVVACAPTVPVAKPTTVPGGTPEGVDIVKAREKKKTQSFEWAPYAKESFARAKAEGRYLLIDGAAEWCHWCHVMDETTYRDEEVGRLLKEKFVAIRVDIDEHPDLADKWSDWGWPATILLTPDAEEIGKFRGYLAKEKLIPVLAGIDKMARAPQKNDDLAPDEKPAPLDALGWIGARVLRDLDSFYDAQQGGWGSQQKAPIGPNIEIELRRALHGNKHAYARATFTLRQQRALLDPVWGGVYQYSAGSDWNDPHFEKLMIVQAPQIEAYTRGHASTKDASLLADANAIARYIETSLSSPDGTFYVNQDADVGAHDASAPFVDGHVYYGKDDAGRRALGIPWVDTHVYARENGLAIAALCTLYEVGKDASHLARAKKAADAILASHVLVDGTVVHDAKKKTGPFYLADAAAFARALARLAEVSGATEGASYKEKALEVAAAMVKLFDDPKTGAMWESTIDPSASGIFARRERSFMHGVVAARAFATLARVTGDTAHRDRARKILAGIATPRGLDEQGRWLGEFLVALDEAGSLTW